jgi:hypothetical protein
MNLKRRGHFGDLHEEGMITLKSILEKYDMKIRT